MCAPSPAFPQYQGGCSFSVFSAQGSNPAFNCKIFGKSVQKVYDKTVKGYVYNCLGGMSSKIQFPKDEKIGLQLVQPYLVLQIFVPKGQHFSLELRAADTQGTRRKMYLSTSFSPVCKLRKIFTMRSRLAQSVLEAKDDEDCLPLEHAFAAGVEATIQVIDTQKIHNLLGIASSVEGREGTATPAAHKKHHPSKIDKHVNVAFGSRMPLPLSTVQINTNLPHDVNTYNPHASRLANVTETQATLETLLVPEPKASPPQTRNFVSGIEKQPRLRALNPKTSHNMMPLHLSDSASFPVQEELHVHNFEPDPVVIDKCLELTSKHGQKLQKLNRRKEMKIHKRHHLIRHSQKENCSQSKVREPKESDVKDSPPGSPPSGWENNSDGGSDSFLFEQHFEELPESTSRGTLPHSFMISHPFAGDACNHNQASQTLSHNGCIMGEGDSYFEKKISSAGKGGLPPLLHWQDHPPIHLPLKNTVATVKDCNYETQKDCFNAQELGSEAFKSHLFASANGLKREFTKPAEDVEASKLPEAGALLEQNGPFGSTEELWIVHEEGDFGDPASSTLNTGVNVRALQLEGSSMTESGVQQLSIGPIISDTIADLASVANTRTLSSSLCISNSSKGEPSSSKSQEKSTHGFQTNTFTSRSGNEIRPANLDSKKPLPSKLEDKELDLLYDPILDCYYDPKTNRYYELK